MYVWYLLWVGWVFFRSHKYAVSPPALLLARSSSQSVKGIALSKQSAQDIVEMIRYELLDLFVSKKVSFFHWSHFQKRWLQHWACKINTFAHYLLPLFLSFMTWSQRSGQKCVVCSVVPWEEALGVGWLAGAFSPGSTVVGIFQGLLPAHKLDETCFAFLLTPIHLKAHSFSFRPALW